MDINQIDVKNLDLNKFNAERAAALLSKAAAITESWISSGGRSEELAAMLSMEAPFKRMLREGPAGHGKLHATCAVTHNVRLMRASIFDRFAAKRERLIEENSARVSLRRVELRIPRPYVSGLPDVLPRLWGFQAETAGEINRWWVEDLLTPDHDMRYYMDYLWSVGVGAERIAILDTALEAYRAGFYPVGYDAEKLTVFCTAMPRDQKDP